MRTLTSKLFSKTSPLLHRLRRNPLPLPLPLPFLLSGKTLIRSIHDYSSNPNPNPETLPSRFLQPIPTNSPTPPPAAETEEDANMNEFLSRFVYSIRGKISEAYPDLPRDTRDSMLLIICQNVIARLDPAAAASDEPPIDLSEDLWKTILDVSASVNEAMRRDRVRAELRKYLHCDEVKQMCRFAGEVGIRGDFLRELRFKWAREKMEEVDFYRELERMRDQIKKEEDMEKGLIEVSEKPKITALPQRKGKIRYKIYGLDMSDPKWSEVSERLEEAEKQVVPEEARPVVGRSKRVEDRIMDLDPKKDDLKPVFKEFEEALSAKRVDWLALLDRINEHNEDLYFKAAELLLDEQTFNPSTRDYSKLIDAHSKAGRIQDAERTLNKMLEKGIQPDVLTSIVLIHMYSKAGDLNKTKEAFEKLRQENFQPDLRVYRSVITAYVNAGVPKQGETLIREMEEKGMKPTREIYLQVLRAFAGSGQVDGARRIVCTMQFAGIEPDLESYKLLIEAYSQAGDPDQARGHFDDMMRSGVKPDDQCTASMVSAYGKKNMLDKAVDLLLKLEKEGFEPGVATNAVLVGWFGKLKLVEEAELLVKKMKESGEELPVEVHVSLCEMYSRAGKEQKVRQLLKILEGRKNVMKGDQFERVVSGLVAGRLLNDAKRFYDVMQERGFTLSESVKVGLMAAQSIPRHEPAKKKIGKDGW
ncbi:hypothetical protein M5K25_003302 [Dendrobium thyrsiflorum]|uniref:PROP1-like PPR domain-containing protein n=1 Tax=Dendrobium thyrsiflorum TaxID=117978 RepID=A0ABD0VJ05_DENTH